MSNRPLLLGHRGARFNKSVPENSLAAFDLARAQGCDGFEFDVRLSFDGVPVIWHDAKLEGKEIAKVPAAQSALPSLLEVLRRFRSSAFLDIELKVPGLENITLELLQRYSPKRGYVISSFLPKVLSVVHGIDAAVPLGLICEEQSQLKGWKELPVQYVIPHYRLAGRRLISEIHDQGKKVAIWTVNSPVQMKRYASWGVDGIISDNPALLAATLGSLEKNGTARKIVESRQSTSS